MKIGMVRSRLVPLAIGASMLLAACQPAYYAAVASPQTSPHARFDVTEWLPLHQ